jgi:DNA-binding protein YbaB
MRAEFEALSAEYERARRQVETVRERMPTMKATAESADKLVKATVGPRGNLERLEIDPRAYRRLSPTQLADAIVATAASASRRMHSELEPLLRPFLAAGAPFEKLMTGEAEWADHIRIPFADTNGNGRFGARP